MPNPTQNATKAKNRAKTKELTGKERRTLRALGHSLSPVVQIGKAGLTRGVTQELQNALDAHELIKIQLLGECPLDRAEAAERIAAATSAAVVQSLGRVLLFFRPNPEKRRLLVDTPKAGTATQDSPKRAVTRGQSTTQVRHPSTERTPRRQSPFRGTKK